jgi:uncharacterized YkwD family protein
MGKKIVILVMILAVLAGCTAPQERPMENDSSSIFETGEIERIRVKVDNLNVRSGCGKEFPVVDTLDRNQTVDVVGKFRDWFVVRLPNDKIGSVPENQVQPVVEEDNDEGTRQVTPAARLTEDEQRMVTLINQERTKRGLEPLKVDMEVTKIARLKSEDMVENNYFSHYSPTYGSPFDMLKSYGVEYVYAGENIAGNRSVERAHESLMNSQGHRENILKREFTHVGIGIARSDRYGYIFTQMFISKPK